MTSTQDSQTNTTAYLGVLTIASVIRQTLSGTGALPTRADNGDDLDLDHRGIAASGDGGTPMQVWVDGGGGNAKNTLATGGYNIDNYGSQAGIQAEVTPTLVLGLSGSWQDANGTLNGGFSSESTTLGLSPYAGWQFDEHWNLSAIAGYSQGHTKLGNAPLSYSGYYQTNQWNFQGGLNGSYIVGPVRLAPILSLLYTRAKSHSFIDSTGAYVSGATTALWRGSAGGAVSLPMTGWEPYIRASAEHDFAVPTGAGANGDNGGTVGAGFTITLTQAIWASLDAGYNSIGRTGLTLWSTDARINFRF